MFFCCHNWTCLLYVYRIEIELCIQDWNWIELCRALGIARMAHAERWLISTVKGAFTLFLFHFHLILISTVKGAITLISQKHQNENVKSPEFSSGTLQRHCMRTFWHILNITLPIFVGVAKTLPTVSQYYWQLMALDTHPSFNFTFTFSLLIYRRCKDIACGQSVLLMAGDSLIFHFHFHCSVTLIHFHFHCSFT